MLKTYIGKKIPMETRVGTYLQQLWPWHNWYIINNKLKGQSLKLVNILLSSLAVLHYSFPCKSCTWPWSLTHNIQNQCMRIYISHKLHLQTRIPVEWWHQHIRLISPDQITKLLYQQCMQQRVKAMERYAHCIITWLLAFCLQICPYKVEWLVASHFSKWLSMEGCMQGVK